MAESFQKSVDQWLAEERLVALARASAIMMDEILDSTPKEVPGRMQATWIGGIEKVVELFDINGINARSLDFVGASNLSNAAPRDDGAWDADFFGESDITGTLTSSTVTFQNALPFADEMEFGGTLTPIAPGGRKRQRVFPGALLSERGSSGTGMLRWVDSSGVERMALSRQLPGTNSIEKGFAAVKRNKKRLGLSFS